MSGNVDIDATNSIMLLVEPQTALQAQSVAQQLAFLISPEWVAAAMLYFALQI